jgi:tungstate transport system ATP-binding protein
MSVLLRVEDVAKRFGERDILDRIDFELEAGVSYVLTGPNGSGKSTLLRILGGLLPPDRGRLVFEGRSVPLVPYPDWLRREIVYVHQHPYLFRSSVIHNLEYGLELRGIPQERRHQIADEAIRWAGLDDVRGVRPDRLSGGEKQRVSLVRARLLAPRVLLLDEPTANLDREAKVRTLDLIQRLTHEALTVVVACHDEAIIALPDMRRLHLEDGLLESCSSSTLRAVPVSVLS